MALERSLLGRHALSTELGSLIEKGTRVTAQEQIAKLESLLDRIRRNASKLRGSAASVPRAEPAPEPEARPLPQMAKPAPVVSPPVAVAPIAAAPIAAAPVAAASAPQLEAMDEAPVLEVSEAAPSADIEDLDMMDVEIVEIAVDSPALEEPSYGEERAPMATLADEPPDTVDEPIPESAPRPAAALGAAREHEVPLKTPPPESGRQAVAGPSYDEPAREADLAGGTDVDSLLEADLSGSPISRAPSAGGPTMEQLGETVELEGADAPAANLELDSVAPAAPSLGGETAADELELELPKQTFSGGYEPPVAAPPAAAPEARPRAPVAAAAPAPAGPTIVERPHVDALAAEVIAAPAPRLPETFIDLLDASLALRA
jgi:hypothetical protein